MGDYGRTDWCTKCEIHLALESQGYVCPVCRDKDRLDNKELYKRHLS